VLGYAKWWGVGMFRPTIVPPLRLDPFVQISYTSRLIAHAYGQTP
jgi:hypothetical protein